MRQDAPACAAEAAVAAPRVSDATNLTAISKYI